MWQVAVQYQTLVTGTFCHVLHNHKREKKKERKKEGKERTKKKERKKERKLLCCAQFFSIKHAMLAK